MSHIHIGLSGRYTIEKRNAAGDVVQALEFDNLITDAGLERWGTAGVIDRCYLGSGSTTPAVTDTAMATPLANTTTNDTAPAATYDAAVRSQTLYKKWRFAPGVGTGDVREVGVGWVSGLWSRALVLDGNGNPMTISKAADETLDVTYAITLQFPPSDVVGVVNIKGADHTWTARPFQFSNPISLSAFGYGWGQYQYQGYATAYSGDLGAFPSGSVSGSSLGSSSSSADAALAYVAASRYRDLKLLFPLNSGNGSLKTVVYNHQTSHPYGLALQVGFSPAIPKLATEELTLVVRISWGRA